MYIIIFSTHPMTDSHRMSYYFIAHVGFTGTSTITTALAALSPVSFLAYC
ncbi:MAG: hypothetical protein NT007_06540 [Candidatus Kapabacteria bacterium]|nr:hypothetical protein [Candidatus Kapabacteria bacterium]